MARMLGAARLSHDTDGSTSVERQIEQLGLAEQMRGDKLVHVTEDVDVSGLSVAPFERPELGEWLTEPEKIAQWDVLAFTKIDRISRNLFDFVTLLKWADAHGKTLVSVTEGIDFGTPVGRLIGQILAMFAEFEARRMAERRADHTRKALAQARWDGRAVAPGYRPVKVGDHWELEIDESKAVRICAMTSAVIGGQSARQVGREYGTDVSGVLSILRNPGLRGYVVHNGDIVRGDDGLPVQRREAILDDDTWNALQDRLDRNGKPGSGLPTKAGSAAVGLGVFACGVCGKPLYMSRRAAGDRYRHRDGSTCQSSKPMKSSKTGKSTPASFTAAHLESAMESELLALVGDVKMVDTIIVPGKGDDIRKQVKQAEESMEAIEEQVVKGLPVSSASRMLSKLESRIEGLNATLAAMPADERDGCTREIPADKTYGQHWAELDEQGRGAFLRANGVTLRARRAAEAGEVTASDVLGAADGVGQSAASVVWRGKTYMTISFGRLRDLAEAARTAAR
jgi:site-specific DNA recombinase